MLRTLAMILVLFVAFLGYVAWRSDHLTDSQADALTSPRTIDPGPSGSSTNPSADLEDVPVGDPGITWTAPARWTNAASRPMRLASYAVTSPGGGHAECAVYYFGEGQGGTTEANLSRWIGELRDAKPARRSSRRIGGVTVTTLRVSGTYVAHGATSAPAPAERRDELIAAVAEAPRGSVFFKLTGPAATVDAAADEFDRMIESIRSR
jgi:hypothetical protein